MPRKPPATPICSHSRFLPTGSPSATAIPTAHCRAFVGAWWSLRTAAIGSTWHTWRSWGTGLEAAVGNPVVALDYAVVAIGHFHDSGNPMHAPLAMLAAVLDRLGRYEPAAIVAGFALSPFTAGVSELTTAIAHLREMLGDPASESLAKKGATMPTAAMVAYAYGQIDQARAELAQSP